MLKTVEHQPFNQNASIVHHTEDTTLYRIDCDTPNGLMQCIPLFPGISLAYTSFYANSCFQRKQSLNHILEISYCSAGRYECEFKRGYYTYLGEGDIAISLLSSHKGTPIFPTGLYNGVALILDMNITGPVIKGIIEDVSIDLKKLVERFCTNRCCTVIKATEGLKHIFQELCGAERHIQKGFLRLKTLELFYQLSEYLPNEHLVIPSYYPGSTISKIKSLKENLMVNLDKKYPLQYWADFYGLGRTTMMECFKAIYGKSIYAFRKEYKMQIASQLLSTTELSVSAIAVKLGYSNPNKFSSAFKTAVGLSPREYRNQNN